MPEGKNPRSRGLDALEAAKMLSVIHEEDRAAYEAIGGALDDLARAVEDAVGTIRSGGSVMYAGAGTSGRLGVLDAAEVFPTFGSNAFRAVMAGGPEAVTSAVEGAEDDEGAGGREGRSLSSNDMAVGISASGRTPFVIGFLKAAKTSGARCWMICSEDPGMPFLDGCVVLDTGAELLAGSTRMKAGTAQKMALTMLSTATMVRLGGSHDGMMVDVVPSNEKLRARAEKIVMEITDCTRMEAAEALKKADSSPKLAALMLKKGLRKKDAMLLLDRSGGSLRKALG
jgi:N-acetylmuramic acid 6-phosphate etherase